MAWVTWAGVPDTPSLAPLEKGHHGLRMPLPGSLLLPDPTGPALAMTEVTGSIVGSFPLAASAQVTHSFSVWVGHPRPPLNIVHLRVVPVGSKTFCGAVSLVTSLVTITTWIAWQMPLGRA